MIITDHKTVESVQMEFHTKFPFLKLEFYKFPHERGEGNLNREKLDSKLAISEIRSSHTSGDLSINGHLKVSTLEQNFKDIFDLNVQVFRRSGTLWLQTTKTDDWTLTEQSNYAQESIRT